MLWCQYDMKKKLALVYQAGIANVFEVKEFSRSNGGRKTTKRLLQHAFSPCEYLCLGAELVGAQVAVYSCNKAGDISTEVWERGLIDCPFAEQAHPSMGFLYVQG